MRTPTLAFIASLFLAASSVLSAPPVGGNLIRNASFEKEDLAEFNFRALFVRPDTKTRDSKFSIFTEDLTWNKCARIDLERYLTDKEGQRTLHPQLVIGGSRGGDFQDGTKAMEVKPETTYEFSLELRGTLNGVGFSTYLYKGVCRTYGDFDLGKTSLKKGVKVTPGWTRYQGTFKTNKETKRAALRMSIYTHERYGLTEKPDTFLMVDNIVIREKAVADLGTGVPPATVHVAGKRVALAGLAEAPELDGKLDDQVWQTAPVLTGFHALRGFDMAEIQTETRIVAGPDALYVAVRCLEPAMAKLKTTVTEPVGPVYRDDCVELFFDTKTPGVTLRQFVVNSAGSRFMGWGSQPLQPKNYQDWQAAAWRGEGEWSLEIALSYDKALGLKDRPAAGAALAFNVARERYAEKTELSSWSAVQGNFHSKDKYGMLVFGTLAEELKSRVAHLEDKLRAVPAELPAEAMPAREKVAATLAQWRQAALAEVTGPAWEKAYVELGVASEQIRFLKLAGQLFAVTVASPTTDFALPFTPDAILDPPTAIECFASINEFESLPIVITNLTDKTEAYRVVLFREIDNGIEVPGLASPAGAFQADGLVLHEAVRVKDSDHEVRGTRLDPLPRMNEAQIITVPPRDSGVVWVTFRCKNVVPGTYKGTLRVIPLNQRAEFRNERGWKYFGDMKDLPVTLTVWPITLPRRAAIPGWFCDGARNEAFFVDMMEHGCEIFQISPYRFVATFNPDGSMASLNTESIDAELARYAGWFKKYDLRGKPCMLIGFSTYDIFDRIFAKKAFEPGTPEWTRAWTAWLQGIDATMRKHGFSNEEYTVEVWDEPHLKDIETVIASLKTAREAVPEMDLDMTFGATYIKTEILERMRPYVDSWCLWDNHWGREDYKAFYAQLQKDGKETWFYACSTNLREDPYRYYRLHPWKALHRKLDVVGLFAYVPGPGGFYGRASWKTTPFGSIGYNNFNRPVTSIRGEALREGMDDLKYLSRLREAVAQAKAKGNAKALVTRADAFLKAAVERVVVREYHITTRAEEARREAATLIMALQQAGD